MSEKHRTRKSWREKLENPPAGLPKVVEVPTKWQRTMGGKNILVPTPILVDELIRKVPGKKLITSGQIRKELTERHKADSTCPMTLGIFLRIISEVAEEELASGKTQITPYWRVVKDDGSLNLKFPGGVKGHAEKLTAEGHTIVAGKGKNSLKVKDFDCVLV